MLAWGYDKSGQLGIGSHKLRTRPVRVKFPGRARIRISGSPPVKVRVDGPISTSLAGRAAAARVVSLFAGGRHSLALLSNGTVLAWGGNSAGQLGNGTPGNSNVPVRVALAAGLRAAGIGAGAGAETLFAITRKS